MSQIVNIVVEGAKDAYFLHELILRRFSAALRQVIPSPNEGLSYTNGEPMEFAHCHKEGCFYRICVNNGYNNIGAMKKHLSDTDPYRELVCSAFVFDSDITGVTEDSGVIARRKYITDKVSLIKTELLKTHSPVAKETKVFLFPNDTNDGDLEAVMKGMALPLHRPFFAVCWLGFQYLLSVCQYLRLSNKSMIYDYVEAMYEKTNKVARVKDKQGYNKNMRSDGLWDWNAKSLEPLVAFMARLFATY